MSQDYNNITDRMLLDMYLSRNENAIAVTAAKYGDYLHKIAFNILSDVQDCEECKNDTYLSAWNHIPPDQPKNFAAYLAKIIRNIAIDKHRERSRQKRIPSEYTTSLEELSSCIPAGQTVESEYANRCLQRAVNHFVRRLSQRKQYIFVCRYYCGDSVASIAASLHISESTVFHELSGIRNALKKYLDQEDLWNE